MQRPVFRFVLGVLIILGAPLPGWAAGQLHLTCHVGGAGGGQSFVGGTLHNSGDAVIAHSYVVVTMLDGQCKALGSVLKTFGSIAAGESLEFRVPGVPGMQRYRLAAVKGFDSEGFEVVSVDDNAQILKSREREEREQCSHSAAKVKSLAEEVP